MYKREGGVAGLALEGRGRKEESPIWRYSFRAVEIKFHSFLWRINDSFSLRSRRQKVWVRRRFTHRKKKRFLSFFFFSYGKFHCSSRQEPKEITSWAVAAGGWSRPRKPIRSACSLEVKSNDGPSNSRASLYLRYRRNKSEKKNENKQIKD